MAAVIRPGVTMTTPFNNSQCIDPDTESFFDFSQLPSPSPSSGSRQLTHAASAITSPTNTAIDNEDLQTPAKPSHEYERFKQQTGLPSGSIAGLGQSFSSTGYSMFSSTGLDEMSLMGDSTMMDAGWNSGLGMGSDVSMNVDMSLSQPAYFFPNDASQSSSDFVDPSAISQEEATNFRVWPGMHQQQAALAKAQAQAQQQRQQQMAQQKQVAQQQNRLHPNRKSGSSQITDARTEETIARVVNQIRQNSQNGSLGSDDSQGGLPHIVRMKKDEDDMDEDERLLNSEEGKKLSSKERRQLRNKVSARAFRSRRKEYIGQLEGEVAMKQNECNELRSQNRELMAENARSRAFIERLLRHQAFTPFLEELSREENLDTKPTMSSLSSTPTPAPAPARKDVNPYQTQQFGSMSQPENPQIGMALIPETNLDLSMLNLNTNNWAMNNMNSFNYQQPQVFAVLELPEGPSSPLDTQAMSGKGFEAFAVEEPVHQEVKHDYPVIQRPVQSEKAAAVEVEDDDAPEFDLYRSSPSTSVSAPTDASIEDHEPLFGDAAPEKVFAHFELFVSDEADNQRLMERFERMCASMEPAFQRIQAFTSHLDT